MNFVGDESLESEIVSKLRAEGHAVFAISEESPGVPDTSVLEMSVQRGEPLITNDKDFGDLIFRDALASVGVILLRLPNMTPDDRAQRLAEWLRTHAAEVPYHHVVIAKESARVRALPVG